MIHLVYILFLVIVLFLANCAGNWFNMKRANSGQVMLEKLRGQKGENSSESTQNMQQQTSDNQEGVEPAHVNTNDASYGDDNFETSSNSNETQSKDREEPLFVKVKGKSNIPLASICYYVFTFNTLLLVHNCRYLFRRN